MRFVDNFPESPDVFPGIFRKIPPGPSKAPCPGPRKEGFFPRGMELSTGMWKNKGVIHFLYTG